MALSDRKEQILQAVVDCYIESCEPVSSAEICAHHLPAVSSATVRNELAALEEMGYLTQPHTSAGRIPTAQAYKLYVDKLMPKRKLSKAELGIVKKYFNHKITELGDMLKSTAKVITEITNLTSVAYIRNSKDTKVTRVNLVRISDDTALVVVVTDAGVIKDAAVEVPVSADDDYIVNASRVMSDAFGGHTFAEIAKPDAIIKRIEKEYEKLFEQVLDILRNYVGQTGEMVLEGSAKILEQPEYCDVSKARAMLQFLDAKEKLAPALPAGDGKFGIKIGTDDSLPDCAIVTASYSVHGVEGSAGVIGPMRMDYPKVLSVLDYIGKTIRLLPDSDEKEKDGKDYDGEED